MKLSLKWVIYYAIFLIAGALILSACSTTRKNEKAFSRVLADEKLFDRVGKRWEEVNPCVNGEIVRGKDSIRVDTVYNNDVVFGDDSVRIDTVENVITKTIIKKIPVYITKTSFRVDTVPDLRRIAIKDAEINNLIGANAVLTNNVKTEKGKKNKLMWWLIGLCGLLGLGLFFKLKRVFIK